MISHLVIVSLVVAAYAVNIRQLPLKLNGVFDNATVLKDSKDYKIETRTRKATIMNVPDVYQATDYTCGPSSLTAVLSYYGKQDIREMYLAELAKTDSEVGTMPEKLHRAILQLGFKAEIRENMSIAELQGLLQMRRPVIVLIQAWKDDDDFTPYPVDFENGHYVVAIGFDNEYIYFEDPWIHGSITFMRKMDLVDRWHGNTDEPNDRHVYGSGVIVMEPLTESQTVIYLE